MNWYSYCGGNPVMFVDIFGLYSSGCTVLGTTKTINNIESKDTGLYGGLRSIAEFSGKAYNMTWEERGWCGNNIFSF